MTTEIASIAVEHEAIARAAFAKVATRDLSNPERTWTEDAVDHLLPVGDAVGRGAIVAFFAELFAALPDFTVEVERVLATDPERFDELVTALVTENPGDATGGRRRAPHSLVVPNAADIQAQS